MKKHDYYLSTACHHGNHDYCKSAKGTTMLSGTEETWSKKPGECKFCKLRCACFCHQPSSRLYELHTQHGEKDSASVLVPKHDVPGTPSLIEVRALAEECDLTVTVRNCARYRGLFRVQFQPAKRFHRLVAEGKMEYAAFEAE